MKQESENKRYRYGHPSHEAFNESLKVERTARTPVDDPTHRPNPRGNTKLGQNFDRERHPDIAKQLDAMKRTEAQRRTERIAKEDRRAQFRAARGAPMVREDRPHPQHRPSPSLSRGVDRAVFNARWAASHEPQGSVRITTTTVTKTQSQNGAVKSKSVTERRETFKADRKAALSQSHERAAQRHDRARSARDRQGR